LLQDGCWLLYNHSGVIVICRANFEFLSCFAYFNDVESVQKEDFDTPSQYVPNSGDAIQSLWQVDVTARPKKKKKVKCTSGTTCNEEVLNSWI